MKKGRKTQLLTVAFISIILLILIVVSSLPENGDSVLSAPFNAVLKPVEKFFLKTSKQVTGYFGAVSENKRLHDEVDELKQDNIALRLQLQKNSNDLEVYSKIKEAYKLKDLFDYTTIEAGNILQRPLNLEADTYRIDKGFSAGSQTQSLQYTVLDEEARLFGRIYSSDKVSSKILPITHAGFACDAISTTDNGNHFRLRGDSQYGQQGFCVIDQIPKEAKLTIGDSIVTGGEGGLFPRGITIGVITEFIADDVSGLRRALVQPATNFDATDIVFVLTGDVGTELTPVKNNKQGNP